MNEKLSIITPVYNANKTLRKCIESIINQKYKNIELILVNDGSNDDSLNICMEYQRMDNRIIVLNGENRGVSYARNKGIEISSGKYIAFVDADDYVSETIYTEMISLAELNNLRMVFCNYYETYENGLYREIDQFYSLNNKIIDSEVIIEKLLTISKEGMVGACWRSIFYREIICENKIIFDTNITIAEDMKFLIEYLKCVKEVGVCREYLYYFYVNNMSTTSNFMKNQERDMEIVNMWLEEKINIDSNDRLVNLKLKICVANTLLVTLSNICKRGTPYSIKERINIIRKKKYSSMYSEALHLSIKNRKFMYRKKWIQIVLIYYNLYVLLIIIKTLKNKTYVKTHKY